MLRGQKERAYRQFIAPINCQGVKVTPLFEAAILVFTALLSLKRPRQLNLVVMRHGSIS